MHSVIYEKLRKDVKSPGKDPNQFATEGTENTERINKIFYSGALVENGDDDDRWGRIFLIFKRATAYSCGDN